MTEPLDSKIITIEELSDKYDLFDGRTGELAVGDYEIPMADVRYREKDTQIFWRWEHGTAFAVNLAVHHRVKLDCFVEDNLESKK